MRVSIHTFNNAHGLYRCSAPAYHCYDEMKDCGITLKASDTIDWAADVIVLHGIYKPHIVNQVRQYAKHKKIVWGLDDDFHNLTDYNPLKGRLGYLEYENLEECLELASHILVSTDSLKQRYGEKCIVAPNLIDLANYDYNIRQGSTCFWHGGNTHAGDLELIADLPKQSKRKFIFFGMLPRSLTEYHMEPWDLFPIPKPTLHNVGFVEHARWSLFLPHYRSLLQEYDCSVGLAPMQDHTFNYSKSNLRILQYWASGLVPVASDIGEYAKTITHGVNGFLATDNWEECIESAQDYHAEAGYEEAKQYTWKSKKKEKWLEFFKTIV